MIVDAVGRNDVLVRYRDSDGKRKEDRITEFLPYCYVEDSNAQWLEGRMESGYKGVFGESLTKVSVISSDEIKYIKSIGGKTWEANIPFANQVLSAKVKRGDKPYEPYNHRVWYLDGEWKISTGEITMLTVYDSFTENLYSWVVIGGVSAGKYKSLLDANNNSYEYDTPVLAFESERELLQHFVGFMRKQDPDIITGWYVAGADIKQIVKRCQKVGVKAQLMSPVNRLRYDYGDWSQPIVGRNVIDLMQAFPKLWELKNGKLAGYKLDDVASECLGEKKVELPNGHDTYYSDPVLYLDYNRQDVILLPKLNALVNAIEYFIAVQHIVQCDIATTPFITKVFTSLTLCDPEVDFQIPTRPMFEKVNYEAAIVLDAPQGIHKNIGIFDVKAMYHSNVNLHNISWETIASDGSGKNCGNGTFFTQDKQGLLGRQMDNMTKLRDKYKALLKDAKTDEERVRYDALQYATKSLVASMYGCAGDAKYGLYHPEIASAITHASRDTLMRLKGVVEKHGFPVVYGHTDSVMCEVHSPQLGMETLDSINAEMSPIIVQFEKWSSTFVLMGKNRYCGLVSWTDGEPHEPKRYVKGIELKQSRMPTIMKDSMGKVIDGILHDKPEQQVTDELSDLVNNIVKGKVNDIDLCMKGKLTNDLENYKSLSGASAGAQWANRTLGKGYRKDDYFLCAIDPKGNYLAFDDPSEIEGIAEIGYRTMVERFIIEKVKPYYQIAQWNIQPLINAMNGKSDIGWL